ncbi:MAG: metal ABC transporter substrate-binding protein [Actinobacteria bacterium]|nr:metal ABC transporter substrate-binding protein [Actinomycetota bacterium]
MRTSLLTAGAAATVLVLASCSSGTPDVTADASAETSPTTAETQGAPSVVVTTTVLGSVVGEILTCALGDDSSMTVLMPLGADPHDFQASSAQVALMAGADLVVVNGLGLEEGVLDAVENVEADGVSVLEIAALVDPLPFGEGHSEDKAHEESHDDYGHEDEHPEGEDHSDEESHDDHGHGEFDPHFWFDMDRMALAAELIGAELAVRGDESFASCGESVAAEIRATEVVVADTLSSVLDANRVLVTDHDALGYLAERYDYDVVGVVIPGGSTLGDANSSDLADLVATIQEEGVRAIFGNTAGSPALLDTLADEVGGRVQVVELFVGSLGGPGSGAESFIEMMTTNATRIASALAD